MNTVEIYENIYRGVFCNTFQKTCYVFLCGGAGKDCIRNDVRSLLEALHFQVLYPEDLFMEMLNRNKKSNLLEYENFLAENADVVCVICESMGSAVELGAFVQIEAIRKKMVIGIDQKYQRDKSFIMMGPVKHIEKLHNGRVVLYKKGELDAFAKSLMAAFTDVRKEMHPEDPRSFETLSAFIAFLPLVVWFYQRLGRKELHRDLKRFLRTAGSLPDRYNELFNAAVQYLLRSGVLHTVYDPEAEDMVLSLSPVGLEKTRALLDRSVAREKTILHDRIRCAILKEQLHHEPLLLAST